MTDVAQNTPQHGFATGVPPQPSDDGGVESPSVTTAMPVSFEKPGPAQESPAEEAAPASGTTSGRVAVQVVDRLRSTAERGTTTVPARVIEKIATLAVREVPGVYEFATAAPEPAAPDGERPLAIEVDGKQATVTMHLVIEYGFAVHAVTEKVRTKVISALENLFSLDVTAVDIVIDDIHLDDTGSAE